MIILVCHACGEPWEGSGNPAICPKCGVVSFGIAVERNTNIITDTSDKNETEKEVSTNSLIGGGSTKMTIGEMVRNALVQYKNDEIMLDAFYQWASNPTSMSAGYGLEENYPYIRKNLMSRYGLSASEADKLVNELKKACDTLINEAQSLPVDTKRQIGEVQRTFLAVLSEDGYENLRRQGILGRLREASEETRKTLLLFNLLENINSSLSANNFTTPPDYYSDRQSEFQAYYRSVFGEIAPILKVAQEIVQSGAYNELYWLPSPTAKSSPGPARVKAIALTNAELDALGTKLPPLPDIPFLLESYWQKAEFEMLRFVDIVSHSNNGVVTTDEPLPAGANVPGFMSSYGKSIALSPRVVAQAKQHMELMKDQKMESVRQTLENALVSVERQMRPDGGLVALWTGQGETVWEFSISPPLYVYLAPWLTTFTQTPSPSRVNFQEKPHVFFVIPCQSRASFLGTLERHSGFSLKETRWEKSLGLLTDLQRPGEFQLLIGQRHPFIDRIFEEVSKPGRIRVEPIPVRKGEAASFKEPAPLPTPPEPISQVPPQAEPISGEEVVTVPPSGRHEHTITFPPYHSFSELVFGRGELEGKIAWGYEIGKPHSYDSIVTSDLTDINEGHIGFFMSVRNGKSTLAASAILQVAFQSIPVVVIDPKADYVSNIIPLNKGLKVTDAFTKGVAPRFENVQQDKRGFDLWQQVRFDYQGIRSELLFQIVTFTKERKMLPRTIQYKAPLLTLPSPEDEDFQEQCDEAATSLTQGLPKAEGKGYNTLISKAMQQFKLENIQREFLLTDDLLNSLDSLEDETFTSRDVRSLKKILSDYQTRTSTFFAKEPEQVSDIRELLNPKSQVTPITILDVSGLPAKGKSAAQQNFISQVCGQIYHYAQRNRGARAVELLLVLDEAQSYLPDPTNQYNFVRKLIQEGPSLGIRVILISQTPQDIEMTARQQLKTLVLSNVPEGTVRYVAETFSLPADWRHKLNRAGKGTPLIINEKTAEEGGAICNTFTSPQMVGLLSPEQIRQAMAVSAEDC